MNYQTTVGIFSVSRIVLFFAILWTLLGVFAFGHSPLNAQTIWAWQEKPNLKEAEKYFKRREYTEALEIYKEALKLDSNDVFLLFQTGICQLKSTNKSEALPYLAKVETKQPNHSPLLNYFLAEAYRYNNLTDECLRRYSLVKTQFEKEPQDKKILLVNDELTIKEFLIFLEQKLQEIKTGVNYVTEPATTEVKNIGNLINSEYQDYAPVISADESILIFTSRRKGSMGDLKDVQDNLYFEDIYISQKKKNGEWEKPKNAGKNINSKYHEASVALSPDGRQLFIYQDDNGGDIYVSQRTGKNQWSTPEKLGGQINTKFREASVSISKDGNTLYFSSDRPGGYGKLDLYKCEKDKRGNWGDAQNLGPNINTAEDDDAPFIHYDSKTLYFSSKGHHTLGGFDIFYSEFINNQWTKPSNLGYPINTPQDDIHFVLSANYKRGYYASSRTDTFGEKDVYVIDMPNYKDVQEIDFQVTIQTVSVEFNSLTANDPQSAVVMIRGVIKDEFNDQLIDAKMSLIDVSDNTVVNEIQSASPKGVYYAVMQTGKKYLIHVQKEGYLFHSEYFELPTGVVKQEKVLNIYLKRIQVAKTIDFKALYDYNSAVLKKQSFAALDNLFAFLVNNLEVSGEISGHTDNIGSDKRNQELSEQRAKSVYDYLIEKGIDKSRLTFVGYGPTKPISSNNTPYGRALNRRTEFKIVKKSKIFE